MRVGPGMFPNCFHLTTTWDKMSRSKQLNVSCSYCTVVMGASKFCCGELILFPGYQIHAPYRAADLGYITRGIDQIATRKADEDKLGL
ncbi:hypothetical protein GGI35DRAFT_446336 [Trichoderma velutinum]